MTPEKKKQLSHDVLTMVCVLGLLVLMTRLWPILLLMVLGLIGYALWMLVRIEKRPTILAPPPLPALPAPVSESELIVKAFGLLTRRVNDQVTAIYPDARWVWETPGARDIFAAGGPLTILLNGAGGYRKAVIHVSNLQLYSLIYLPQAPVMSEDEEEHSAQANVEEARPEEVDYGLLAFEWVEANMQRLNVQGQEALAKGNDEFCIPAEDLPHGDSWAAVCEELVRNGFVTAEALAGGIRVQLSV